MARHCASCGDIAFDSLCSKCQDAVSNFIVKLSWGPGVECPEQCRYSYSQKTNYTVARMVEHLNDIHEWKWEKIIKWLDTQEEVILGQSR